MVSLELCSRNGSVFSLKILAAAGEAAAAAILSTEQMVRKSRKVNGSVLHKSPGLCVTFPTVAVGSRLCQRADRLMEVEKRSLWLHSFSALSFCCFWSF